MAITGCTTGTGFIAATAVAKKGAAQVLMLNRASERAAAAEQKVQAAAQNDSSVKTIACDLTDFDAVRTAAEEIKKICPDGIDVLCCNAGVNDQYLCRSRATLDDELDVRHGLHLGAWRAGVMANPDEATKDGYDVQMQTNHLSHFLLTKELMPLLEKAASRNGESRIVSMTSEARKMPSTPLQAKYYGKNGGNLGGNGSSMLFGGARWERYSCTSVASHKTVLNRKALNCATKPRPQIPPD